MIKRRLGRAVLVLCCLALLPCAAARAQHVSFDPHVSIPTMIEFQVDVILSTSGNTVQGMDFSFTYEPGIVRLDSIAAGDWLLDSGHDHFLWIDPVTPPGAVHVTTALLGGGSTSNGSIITLNFTAIAAGISPLHFLAIELRDEANAPYPFATHSTGDLIVIEEAVGNHRVGWSEIKSAYR